MPSQKGAAIRRGSVVWMCAGFLLTSVLVSIAFLSLRNMYDDEVGTANLLRTPTKLIIANMNKTDVHPPGMYVLSHLCYQLLQSPRWVTLFPLSCLYAGLALFIRAFAPLLRTARSRAAFLMVATLHPQLLMWSNSIRWYPWWTGIALAAVVVALQPGQAVPVSFRSRRAIAVGLLLGGLFYINYITLLFTFALVVGLLVRYGWRIWKRYFLMAFVAIMVMGPQLHAFLTVHMRESKGQRSNLLLSFARLTQGLATSEAYLPWHPLAISAALLFLTLLGAGLVACLRYSRRNSLDRLTEDEVCLMSEVVLAFTFFVLVIVTGLGGKPRNAVILVPLLAPAIALATEVLFTASVQYAIVGVLAIWSGVGISHLLRREGLAKAGMGNRPEEVFNYISSSRGESCSMVVTYDPVLSFYLAERKLPRQMILILTQNTIYDSTPPLSAMTCSSIRLYLVESYMGGFGTSAMSLPNELRQASTFIHGPHLSRAFSFDPDASIKRRLHFIPDASSLPDYRYVVTSGQVDPSDLDALDRNLPHFAIADGHSLPLLK